MGLNDQFRDIPSTLQSWSTCSISSAGELGIIINKVQKG